MIIIVMGVTGCGKTTVGRLLAGRLSLPFFDADDFHPGRNIIKMSKGTPLTDKDRYPWLLALSKLLQSEEKKEGAVLACSALKERYRELLQQEAAEKIIWICLEGSEKTIRERMQARTGHFMPETLLQSQLKTLEKPVYAHCLSIEKDPEAIVSDIVELLNKPGN